MTTLHEALKVWVLVGTSSIFGTHGDKGWGRCASIKGRNRDALGMTINDYEDMKFLGTSWILQIHCGIFSFGVVN